MGRSPTPTELAEFEDRVCAYVEKALPGLEPKPLEVLHCWVTQLPWGEDAVSVWEAEGALFIAGHNLFKQAPALGRMLADAAFGEGLDPRFEPDARLGAPPGLEESAEKVSQSAGSPDS